MPTTQNGHASSTKDVLVTGATGYMGGRLIPALLARGHRVRGLARASSMARIPAGATAVEGDALSADSLSRAMRGGDTVVHLIGTPHPNPAKAQEFVSVDLASAQAVAEAGRRARIAHLIYVSVAHPAPTMHAYIAARVAAERAIHDAQLTATILRPWYVLGPGHRWPLVLVPLYWIGSCIPSLREGATRLGLVTLSQMVTALVAAVEAPPPADATRVVDVPAIRAAALD